MTEIVSPYPLAWPQHFPRTSEREAGRFKTSLSGALKNVETSLTLFGRDSGKAVGNIVLSSNITLGVNKPADPGVAAWFTWDGLSVCIPVDRYSSVEANLQAIHHVVEARRVELRHGTLALVRATMTGFTALPAPDREEHWSVILGVERTASREQIADAFRRKASQHHPDRGGTDAQMARINAARAAAMREAAR